MNLIPLSFILAGLLALPAAAGSSPAPALVDLDRVLTQTLQEKAQGQLAPERVAEFMAKFRIDLAAAETSAPPTPENKALDGRIVARLGELNVGMPGVKPTIKSVDARSALSRTYLDEMTIPAVISEESRILSSDPFSENRRDSNDVAPSVRRTRKIRFVPVLPNNLPIVLPVKVSPAAAPPEITDRQTSQPRPFPLMPLAVAAGLGAAAYGVSQSKSTHVSADGLDDEHPTVAGPYQRLVANTILAGAAGGAIFLAGSAVIAAAMPIILRYMPPIVEQGVRLAGSEAGALNPAETEATNEIPTMLARVIPLEPETEIPPMIGRIGEPRAFVTASEDITGLNALDLAKRLGIKPAREFLIIRFPTSATGLSTPLHFDHPEFIGRGLTSGGAREFFIENAALPHGATFEVVK